jgi:hypothetical protein
VTVTHGQAASQVKPRGGMDRSDSQADSASSILVTRSRQYLPRSDRLPAMIAISRFRPLGTPTGPIGRAGRDHYLCKGVNRTSWPP